MVNEQIKEMARDICHLNVSCDECTMFAKQMGQSKERYCKAMQYAKRAYEKGYRKQSEGKWKPIMAICNRVECNKCGEMGVLRWKYCPNCGAKMKGADDE